MVVNAHANGPNVYAHEIYTLRHAVPGTYQVVFEHLRHEPQLRRHADRDPNRAALNKRRRQWPRGCEVHPEDAGALRGSTVSIRWTVSGPATYATQCTVVTLD